MGGCWILRAQAATSCGNLRYVANTMTMAGMTPSPQVASEEEEEGDNGEAEEAVT